MKKNPPKINNTFYDFLNEKWLDASDHPVALLRAENTFRNPWIIQKISQHFPSACNVLDVGCGAGFLTLELARAGHQVFGIDVSSKSLKIAELQDVTKSICYLEANACKLPFADGSFDVVCAMDLLEHIENPGAAIKEMSRVLKSGGIFFFHTFNRTWWSWLSVIKGVEWMVANTPRHMHIFDLFIKPEELESFCKNSGLAICNLNGFIPAMNPKTLLKMLLTRKVPSDFRFKFSKSLKAGYLGFALKLTQTL